MTQMLVMSDPIMATEAFDLAMLVPSWSEREEWVGRTHLYVHHRPKATAEGARVWLCQGRTFFYSYRVDGFVELAEALPAGGDAGAEEGWALQVSDGRKAERSIEDVSDPSGVATRWSQGFRYLAPGGREFVRAPRQSRAKATAAEAEPTAVKVPQRRRFGKGRRDIDSR